MRRPPPKKSELCRNRGRQVKDEARERKEVDALSVAVGERPIPSDAFEEALVERCKRGEREAFDTVVELYKDKIVTYLAYMVGDEEEAQDLAQEVFVKAYLAIGKFRGDCSLQTWLYRIAHNLGIDHMRRRKRSPEQVSLDAPVQLEKGEVERQWAGEACDPVEEAERGELAAMVREAVMRLPEKLRAVVILHDLQQMTYEEVAKVLGCPVGTVKSRLFHARSKLREILGPMLGEVW